MSSVAGQSASASRPASRLECRPESRFESRLDSRPSSRASARPSSTTGLYTPVSDAELSQSRQNVHDATAASASPAQGKRKRDGPAVAADGLLKAPIVLRPHPSSLTVKPRMLHPLMLLPREHLPLSSLDLSQPHGDLPSSRLFESKIKILDLEGRLGSNVLLVRSEASRLVYALERENSGLYVLCKIGTWVDIERLSVKATVVCWERVSSARPVRLEPENVAAPPLTTPSLYKENKRRKLAIEEIQSLVRKRSLSVIEKGSPGQVSAAPAETPGSKEDDDHIVSPAAEHAEEAPTGPGLPVPDAQDTSAPNVAAVDDPQSQPNADDIFENIRAQYMEALYHSKGSLAYFAKGPLSRARAAFHLDWESNLDMSDLLDFLKGLVMTTVIIDKKFRETIPEIVAKVKTLVGESDTGAPKPRKRKAKKPKLGKDGLYPGEVDHIRRWWWSRQPVSTVDDEKTLTATENKYHISCLRRRETQLQMIIILEILALEPLALAKGPESRLPGMEPPVAASREASLEPLAKKRNKHNLPVLLDVHADRLCIWQSTTSDEIKAVAESQMPTAGHEGEKAERANSDPLRDFCVDIIMPFFSARLPGPCDSLNRKLGGPVAQSPPKEKATRLTSASLSKPGAPIKRPAAAKRDKHRTLERALSVERSRRSVSRGPAATIALLRSASQTVIPGLKREASESTLIGLIPKAEAGSFKERPTSIFSRSVSLSGADIKAQKKAHMEAELQDAISALKKPNRTLAVKDIVEAAETRRASAGQLKKMKKPSRASLVQVKATPANNRFKDALAAETSQSQPLPTFDIPPSSASVVPASTLRPQFGNRLGNRSQTADRIHATPARRPNSSIPATGLRPMQETPGSGILPSSPIMARKAAPPAPPVPAIFASVARPRSRHLAVPTSHHAGVDLPSSPGLGALFETPIAPRSAKERMDMVDDTPIRPRLPLAVAGDGGNRSVFGLGRAVGGEKGKARERGGSLSEDRKWDGAREGEENGVGTGVSIYEQLGWDRTDLDDIDDLL